MKLAAIENYALPESVRTPRADGSVTGLSAYIAIVWASIFLIAGIFTLIYLLYGGFRYITATGDPKSAEEARKIISNAIIGLAILSVSYGVVSLLSAILGVDILYPKFPGVGE